MRHGTCICNLADKRSNVKLATGMFILGHPVSRLNPCLPVDEDGRDGNHHEQQTENNDYDAVARKRLCKHTHRLCQFLAHSQRRAKDGFNDGLIKRDGKCRCGKRRTYSSKAEKTRAPGHNPFQHDFTSPAIWSVTFQHCISNAPSSLQKRNMNAKTY